MAEKRVIKISAEIEPTLKGMNQIIQKLQEGLSKGSAQIDFTKGAGKQVSRLFDTFTDEYKKFQSLTKNGNLDILDSKKALQSGEKIISTFRDLQRIVGDFSSLTVVDAKKLFPEAFDKRVDDTRQALNGLLNITQKLNNKGIELNSAKAELATLTDKVKELNSKITDTTQLKLDITDADKALDGTKEKVVELQNSLKKAYGEQFQTVTKELNQANERLNRAKSSISKDITTHNSTVYYQNRTRKQWENDTNISYQKRTGALTAFDNYNKTSAKIRNLEEDIGKLQTRWSALNKVVNNFGERKIDKAVQSMRSLQGEEDTKKANELSTALLAQADAASKAEKARKELNEAEKTNKPFQTDLDRTNKKLIEQTQKVKDLEAVYKNLSGSISFESLKTALSGIGVQIEETDLQTAEGLTKIRAALDGLDNKKLEELKSNLKEIGVSADQADKFVDKFRDGMGQAGQSVQEFTSHQKEVEQFRDRLLQFFSISNSVQLFKRAIRSAFETVKELDGAMTEIAVVSDFSVGDMWEKLPQFTAQANELGVAIKDTYNATALYIQQGLDLQHSMELSNETLKMARIAGMEAANATDAMTSALRGFNMELNETSAKRVNDVYSELAAITASNVEELSTAMSKTASIAHSVNMEFETTAALLAQGIETTRESAETIGTALKTVIGRFSEIKSLYTKGQLTGTDENGEEINVNKVQKALRAAGVDMTKFFTGEEGLDQVFLDLSKKWDSLDITTQRYL